MTETERIDFDVKLLKEWFVNEYLISFADGSALYYRTDLDKFYFDIIVCNNLQAIDLACAHFEREIMKFKGYVSHDPAYQVNCGWSISVVTSYIEFDTDYLSSKLHCFMEALKKLKGQA